MYASESSVSSVHGVRGGVVTANVAAPHGRVEPGDACGYGRSGTRETGPLPSGNDQFASATWRDGRDQNSSRTSCTVVVPSRRSPVTTAAQVIRPRRHFCRNTHCSTCPRIHCFWRLPQRRSRHRNLAAVLQKDERIGQIGDGRHRRQKSGGSSPVRFTQSSPGPVVRVDAAGRGLPPGGKIFRNVSRSARRLASALVRCRRLSAGRGSRRLALPLSP